jgi:hypothetical protein
VSLEREISVFLFLLLEVLQFSDVVVDEDEEDFEWSKGEEREAETTAGRGGSDWGGWESVGPEKVGGLKEDLETISTAMKFERKDPEPRKHWPGSRKNGFIHNLHSQC